MMGETAVSLSGVSHAYGSTPALREVSLDVRRGEMFGLVGPDGAGKTTLLRILAGVITPLAGTVTWSGPADPGHGGPERGRRAQDPERGRRAQDPGRGYLSQGFSLYQDLTVDENIEFFAEIHGVADYRGRSEELLSFVGLLPFRRRAAGHLSGGMKKKLALACAMVHRPQVLLLDEPTTGVDPVSRRDFWMLLVQLLREGITVVISTPYLDEAERCMRVGLLEGGAFLSVDEPAAVKRQVPGTVLEVISADQRGAYRALSGSGRFDPQQLQPFGDRLHVISTAEDEEEAAGYVQRTLEVAGVPVETVRPIPSSLENAFISLVRERRQPE